MVMFGLPCFNMLILFGIFSSNNEQRLHTGLLSHLSDLQEGV